MSVQCWNLLKLVNVLATWKIMFLIKFNDYNCPRLIFPRLLSYRRCFNVFTRGNTRNKWSASCRILSCCVVLLSLNIFPSSPWWKWFFLNFELLTKFSNFPIHKLHKLFDSILHCKTHFLMLGWAVNLSVPAECLKIELVWVISLFLLIQMRLKLTTCYGGDGYLLYGVFCDVNENNRVIPNQYGCKILLLLCDTMLSGVHFKFCNPP